MEKQESNKIKLDPNKPTILICSDSAAIHTGLARVLREVFYRIHQRNEFNIVQHGWFHMDPTERPPWPIITTQKAPPGSKTKISMMDKYGQLTFPRVLAEVKPDIVFAFHDPWNLAHIANYSDKEFRLISYTCVDSEPMPANSRDAFENSDILVLFGEWAKKVVSKDPKFNTKEQDIRVIPHGVDTNKFYPIGRDEKRKFRQALLGTQNDDFFLFGCVARNQPRKNLGRMMQLAWHLKHGTWSRCSDCEKVTPWKYNAQDRDGIEPVKCLHCGGENLVRQNARDDILFYFHGAIQDLGWDLNELRDRYNCEECFHFRREIRPVAGVSDVELNLVYNCFDVFTLPTRAEGFGLPILEAMSAGTPVLLPNYSAYMEWAQESGLFVEGEMYVEPGLNCERIEIWMHDYLDKAWKLINDKELRTELSENARQVALDMDWNDLADKFYRLFKESMEIDVEGRFSVTAI